jgi:hypothetical protein
MQTERESERKKECYSKRRINDSIIVITFLNTIIEIGRREKYQMIIINLRSEVFFFNGKEKKERRKKNLRVFRSILFCCMRNEK